MNISNEELIEFLQRVEECHCSLPSRALKARELLAKLQPPLKKIDLSNLDPRVPVRVVAEIGRRMNTESKS